MLDKEDNIVIYVCSYSHRSYIVMDPPTCAAFSISFASKKSAPSRDTTCASKILNPVFAMRVHYIYIWIEKDTSSKLSSVQAIKIAL